MELDREFLGDKLIKSTSMRSIKFHKCYSAHCFHFRTILSNPIVTPIETNERDDNVQSTSKLFQILGLGIDSKF